MSEYKDSLNLPTTKFPMKANLTKLEPQILANWQKTDVYSQMMETHAKDQSFILHDGPPYANGHLHCGHALNKILKDLVIKAKFLSGFKAPMIPGWDCHGLPIELNVEKKVGKIGMNLTAEDFRQDCRYYAYKQIAIQKEELKRLGVFADWQHPYYTMDYSYEANIVRALGEVIKNGHLVQGFKPVHWCIDCRSALAEAEVEYEEKTSPSIDVAFLANEPASIIAALDANLAAKPFIVPIWTTTPWTLPANEAVALHPEIDYAVVDLDDKYLLIAAVLVATTMNRYALAQYKIAAQAKGKQFANVLLKHPFYERLIPIVLSRHVTTDAGTGAVHTAPTHGPDDYLIGKIYNLPMNNLVHANGCYIDSLPLFAGRSVLKAEGTIINVLKEKDLLLAYTQIQHSYPHCWRHKTPVIFLATPQWFISMDQQGLRAKILNKIKEIKWIPAWGAARITKMVENRDDWCISRQRAWGTPMTLFVHNITNKLHPRTIELIAQIAKLIEQQGIAAWFALNPSELLGAEAQDYRKLDYTLDVWFDSGVSHFCVLKHNTNLHFPADLYLEGSDQHRGWFNSSLTTAMAISNTAPYKEVLTHGYTVDAEGYKLSKSRGNYIALDKLVNQHGADILRLWVASTDYRNEVSISEEIIKRNTDAYRRIRNTARFLLANLFDFIPEENSIAGEKLLELDRFILQRCMDLQAEIIMAYDNYNFHIIYQKIHNFCALDLGGFYLDIIKDRQYTNAKNSQPRRSCQTVMFHILHALVRWLAPILSFTAEEIWQFIPQKQNSSIFLETWYNNWPLIPTVDLIFWQKIQEVRNQVNKALENQRQQNIIGSSLAAEVTVYANDENWQLLNKLGNELRFVFITSAVYLKPLAAAPKNVNNNTSGLIITVASSMQPKCNRCWHRSDSVGLNTQYVDLCDRCASNISGHYEERLFA